MGTARVGRTAAQLDRLRALLVHQAHTKTTPAALCVSRAQLAPTVLRSVQLRLRHALAAPRAHSVTFYLLQHALVALQVVMVPQRGKARAQVAPLDPAHQEVPMPAAQETVVGGLVRLVYSF